MEELNGFRCHVKGCHVFVPGRIEDLKSHYKSIHGLNTSANSNVLFACSACNISYCGFRSLKRHLLSFHSNIEAPCPQDDDNEAFPSDEFGESSHEIETKNEFGESSHEIETKEVIVPDITNDLLLKKTRNFVTSMRSDPSLPESKIQAFMAATKDILCHYQQNIDAMIKQFLRKKCIPSTDEDADKLLRGLNVDELFTEVKTPAENLSYLAHLAQTAVSLPKEVVLGKRQEKTLINCQRSVGKKPKLISNIRIVKDTAHYISVIETLSLILRQTAARQMIASEGSRRSEGYFSCFLDGQLYSECVLLRKYPETVRLSLHLDDVEYLNPLGSRKTKQKITMISFRIENIHPAINATPSRIYLAMAVRSADVKKYGFKGVLKPLIDDLLILQSEAGVRIAVDNGTFYTLRAVLCHVVGDTLALHELFELLSPSATLFCRACYATREDLRSESFGTDCLPRTVESVKMDLVAVQENRTLSGKCGMKMDCALNALPGFSMVTHNTFDPMHDLLEGVVKKVLGNILLLAVKKYKCLTVDDVNRAIDNFYYGPTESRDKPGANFKLHKLNTATFVSQSAAQMWLLLRAFPFLFNHVLTFGEEYRQIIGELLKITFISFSDRVHKTDVEDLDKSIKKFYKLFLKCFPDTNHINKMHHLHHYPDMIRQHGPLVFFSCMLWEMKFRESKAVSKTCNNFRNLTYSITKRLNLRQVQTILNYDYTVGRMEIVSSKTTSRDSLLHSQLFCDLPDVVQNATHVQINNTSFRTGSVVMFKSSENMLYGIIETMAVHDGSELHCAINSLQIMQYCAAINSIKVAKTDKIVRVEKKDMATKKTYDLWTMTGEPGYYVSLKFNEW